MIFATVLVIANTVIVLALVASMLATHRARRRYEKAAAFLEQEARRWKRDRINGV